MNEKKNLNQKVEEKSLMQVFIEKLILHIIFSISRALRARLSLNHVFLPKRKNQTMIIYFLKCLLSLFDKYKISQNKKYKR